jgi:hypothetical protein
MFSPCCAALADLNNDGKVDLLLAMNEWDGGSIKTWLGNGDGSFRLFSSFEATLNPNLIALTDFNGDGILDIYTVRSSVGMGVYGYGNGLGRFTNNAQHANAAAFPPKPVPYPLAFGDLNEDGFSDTIDNLGVVRVYVQGTTYTNMGYAQGSQGTSFRQLTVADLNLDGHLDFMGTHSGGITIALGRGNGTFNAATNFSPSNSVWFTGVEDFNGDAKPDLLAAFETNAICAFPGDGRGKFDPAFCVHLDFRPDLVSIADLNGDGLPDLAVASSTTNLLSILLNLGHFQFQLVTNITCLGVPNSLAVGDLNGDGRPDLVLSFFLERLFSIYTNRSDAISWPKLALSTHPRGLKLSWPLAAARVLQSSDGLAPGDQWTAVTNRYVQQGDKYTVITQPTNSARFYRLRDPSL